MAVDGWASSSAVGPLRSLILRKLSSSCLMAYKDRQASSTVGDSWLTWQRDCSSSPSLPSSFAFYGRSIPCVFHFVIFGRWHLIWNVDMLKHCRSKIKADMLNVTPPPHGLIQSVSRSLYSCFGRIHEKPDSSSAGSPQPAWQPDHSISSVPQLQHLFSKLFYLVYFLFFFFR